jgi:hypothetical protein
MPAKATGIDVAKAAIAAATIPDVRFPNHAAMIPRIKPKNTAAMSPLMARTAVEGNCSRMICETERWVYSDEPRSPWRRFARNFRY